MEFSNEEFDDFQSSKEIDYYLTYTWKDLFTKKKEILQHIPLSLDSSDEEWYDFLLKSCFANVNTRKVWMHPLNMKHEKSEFFTLCSTLRQFPDKFSKYYYMCLETFNYILWNIEKDISKHSRRAHFCPAEKLTVTLRYLTTGISFHSLAQSFRMDNYTVGLIVHKVCRAIYANLVTKHLSIPSIEKFKSIATDLEKEWNFPHVLGAIDGKHIQLRCPPKSGTMYFNYKSYFSIVLQAVSDSKYRFLFVDIGGYGKQSDGGTFNASTFSSFNDNPSNLPADEFINGIDIAMPFVFLADEAYPLKKNIKKPYARINLTNEEMIFNGRLSRARRCVECSFGVLSAKWRILFRPIDTEE